MELKGSYCTAIGTATGFTQRSWGYLEILVPQKAKESNGKKNQRAGVFSPDYVPAHLWFLDNIGGSFLSPGEMEGRERDGSNLVFFFLISLL